MSGSTARLSAGASAPVSRSVSGLRNGMALAEGDPSRLGAHWDGEGVLFSVYSEHAEQLELCLFDESNNETARFRFDACDSGVWHGYLPGIAPGARYGFRAHGDYAPERGLYFNPNRLLLDPYAKALAGSYQVSEANTVARMSTVANGSPILEPAIAFNEDNAAFVPRSVVIEESGDSLCVDNSASMHRSPSHRVIYEAHLAGLTALKASLPEELRGRFSGAGSAEIIQHLRALGVTSLQLLPVQAFVDEPHLARHGLQNYWGYNTLNFFSPHRDYACVPDQAREEMKALVRALHDANIEVLLDVVYNHTAEGGADGPTLCFRGLDNLTYYRLDAAADFAYINDTGCGNTLNTNHPVVQALVRDSLKCWATEYGVDGFRFDLAVSLGREPNGFSPDHALLESMRTDPVLSTKLLIAEPWDIGPGGYQTGGFGKPWLEWNDRFRDAARSYWRNDKGAQAELGKRLHGSSDLFELSGREPAASVNFISAHDGFTLADMVAYESKHNEANCEENRDGHGHNLSANLGVEGPTDDPGINAARDRRARALLSTLVLAQGTPMLLAGDELKNSQGGNNNAYCQNNATGWVQWQENANAHINLFSRLTDLRKQLRVYAHNDYVHVPWAGQHLGPNECALSWRCFDGTPMNDLHWQGEDHEGASSFALLWATQDELVLLALNPSAADQPLRLPEDFCWRGLLDSSQPAGIPTQELAAPEGAQIFVPSQSLCVFFTADKRCTVTEVSA